MFADLVPHMEYKTFLYLAESIGTVPTKPVSAHMA